MKSPDTKPALTLLQLGLHGYALLMTAIVWVLVWMGGLVTSKEAGMSVPDWPTSFGYNMFLLPISKWTGGVFYEHTHRLVGSIVGLIAVGLMVLLYAIEHRVWVRRLGVVLLLLVITQGVLGGLRVVLAVNNLGLVHGCLGQLILATSAALTLFTSPWWERVGRIGHTLTAVRVGWIKHVRMVTILIILQLALGATMRAAHAGLAIPDFPKAYGMWWPHVTPEELAGINLDRVAHNEIPITRGLIHLQMTHRLMAGIILLAVLASTVMALVRKGMPGSLKTWSVGWSLLVILQVFLGAWTIWSGKAADIATAHVAVGALLLTSGVIQVLMARRINEVVVATAEKNPVGAPMRPVNA
jgi:cytochrome c oxidase assembly protein subunit 15